MNENLNLLMSIHRIMPPELFDLSEKEWFEVAPAKGRGTEITTDCQAAENQADHAAPVMPSDFNGLLGVLRQESPALERRRQYDFWVKPS